MRVVWQCEIDDYASKVLKKHWPDVPNLGDITKVNWDEVERVDVLCGGFPCQDISIAGKGAGLEGARSGLWWQFHKAISFLRPRYVIVENSPMLNRRGLDAVLASLSEIGYDAEWNIVSARFVGALHERWRLFIIAYPVFERLQRRKMFGEPQSTRTWGQEQFERLVQMERKLAVSASKGSGIYDGVSRRMDRLRCLGNAVVPQVAEFVGRCLLRNIENGGE